MSFQKIIIAGALGADPISRVTQQQKQVAQINVAVNDGKNEVTWFKVVGFETTAELMTKYLKKGSKVLIEGRMKFDKYTDKNGVEKTGHSVVASRVVFLSSKSEAQQTEPTSQDFGSLQPAKQELPFEDDDIPF
jgi:single-strand DNA-binding protein